MADNIVVTPGVGAPVRGKNIAGVVTQIVQIDLGGQSAEFQLIADPTYGVPVDIKRFPAGAVLVNNPTAANLKVDPSGVTSPVSDAGGSLTVDAPVATPVFVRLSDGTNPIATLPVSGTVTANQGTAAVTAGAWPIIVSDGTNVAQVDSSTHGLKVYVVGGVTGGVSIADGATFTEASSSLNVIGGEYNTGAGAVTSGRAGAVQITQNRGLHVNLRAAAGTEIGSAAAPLRIDPTGTTIQPVSGTVSGKLLDNTGAAYGPANVLYTSRGGRARTRVTKSQAVIASQTNSVIWTPTTGKAFYVEKIVLAISVTGTLTLFDNTNAAANILSDGTMPVGYFVVTFDEPWPSSAVNNILKYTSGTGLTGVATFHGFEV